MEIESIFLSISRLNGSCGPVWLSFVYIGNKYLFNILCCLCSCSVSSFSIVTSIWTKSFSCYSTTVSRRSHRLFIDLSLFETYVSSTGSYSSLVRISNGFSFVIYFNNFSNCFDIDVVFWSDHSMVVVLWLAILSIQLEIFTSILSKSQRSIDFSTQLSRCTIHWR